MRTQRTQDRINVHPERSPRSSWPRLTSVIVTLLAVMSIFGTSLAVENSPAAASPGQGYLLFGSDGGAFAFGNRGFWGAAQNSGQTIVGGTEMATGNGYWEAGSQGGVYTEPSSGTFYGSIGSINPGQTAQSWLGAPIVGMAAVSAAAGGGGYWIAASNGEVCGFGTATVWSYDGGPANNWCAPALATGTVSDIVGIESDPTGNGYWLVGADGGVFTEGAAGFYGSVPGSGVHISNIVAMAPTANGAGYWLAGSDGGVFTFGNAGFYGSYGGAFATSGVTGIMGTPDSGGYWLVRSTGAVLTFGDAAFLGSLEYQTLAGPIDGLT
jgi:hypothetical protein